MFNLFQIVIMGESPEIIFSQCGQGLQGLLPSPSLSWHIPEQQGLTFKKTRTRREPQKRKQSTCQSFVINNEKKKGIRLIQIKVLDISDHQTAASDSEEVIVLNAQYVVSEPTDNIMDETQTLINKISKKLCDDNSCNYMY